MACKSPKYRKSAGSVVACGQCTPCLLKRKREKCSRVLLESKANGLLDTLFVTLTYDNAHLPTLCVRQELLPGEDRKRSVVYQCPTGTLDPDHPVKFLKLLRYYMSKEGMTLRDVYVGEYGDKNKRPHYHFILWGLPYNRRELIYKSWVHKKIPMCSPQRIDVQIPKSERHIAQYLTAYILQGKRRKGAAVLNGAYPEFYRTSKGLGLQYANGVAKALSTPSGLANLWIDGKLPSSFFFDGKNYPLDRYMKGKIYERLSSVLQEELPKAALTAFKEEMYLVYEDALLDEAFAQRVMNLPLEKAMEEAVRLKNAARATQIEKKHSFFTTKKGD